MTLKDFKKSTFKHVSYFKSIKTQEDVDDLAKEIRELTSGGQYEAVYELAQMEGVDMDDIFDLIR